MPEHREIKRIAKSRPAEHGLPFSTWSLAKLADFLVAAGVVDDISHAGLRLLLREEGVSFQLIKTWKISRDSEYAAKKARVKQLYANPRREQGSFVKHLIQRVSRRCISVRLLVGVADGTGNPPSWCYVAALMPDPFTDVFRIHWSDLWGSIDRVSPSPVFRGITGRSERRRDFEKGVREQRHLEALAEPSQECCDGAIKCEPIVPTGLIYRDFPQIWIAFSFGHPEDPEGKVVEHIRSVLVATGALPKRDEQTVRLERHVKSLFTSPDATVGRWKILYRYATLPLLRRLRRRSRGKEITHYQLQVAATSAGGRLSPGLARGSEPGPSHLSPDRP